MSRMKELAITQQEEQLSYLYDNHYAELLYIDVCKRWEEKKELEASQAEDDVMQETIKENQNGKKE